MKIAILSQYFYPETGAPQNRLLELVRIFKKNNREVTVITAMPNYPKGKIFDEYKGRFRMEDEKDGISIRRYTLFASNSSKKLPRIISMLSFSFTSLFSFLFIKKFKPDFFFVESPPLTLALSAYYLSRFSKSKLIMNISDIWPLSAKELGYISNGALYKKLESLEKFLYKKSFLITGQSQEIIDHVKSCGFKNVYLFRNGVDVNRFKNLSNKTLSEKNLKIVYAGLLGVAQGVSGIIRNIDFNKLGVEFHIYGEGAERKDIEIYLKDNKNRNVYLHDSVKSDEIPVLLDNFNCTIIPLVKNIYGAVPSKIYEAMSAGLPVLFSGTGEGAKIIREHKAGLISEPGDYNKLGENIQKLRDSIELRKEFSDKGKLLAQEYFDRNKLIKDFSDKLDSLL